jgi:hypothetical protein
LLRAGAIATLCNWGCPLIINSGGNIMKGMNQKKDAKKKPEKTLKEKRAEKDAKKAAKR